MSMDVCTITADIVAWQEITDLYMRGNGYECRDFFYYSVDIHDTQKIDLMQMKIFNVEYVNIICIALIVSEIF